MFSKNPYLILKMYKTVMEQSEQLEQEYINLSYYTTLTSLTALYNISTIRISYS
jgi:hypothetical protein